MTTSSSKFRVHDPLEILVGASLIIYNWRACWIHQSYLFILQPSKLQLYLAF